MTHTTPRAVACLSLFAALTLAPRTGAAADAVAESMYQEAVEDMKHGRFQQACPKLEASQKLEARSGTLMTLASCSERIGKTATAWAQYKDAAAIARKEGRDDYAAKATELAAQLEPRLSKLRIDAEIQQAGAQLTVRLDGQPVLTGTFGVAFAIDPGEHVVEASAPGRADWSTTVVIENTSDSQVVAVPQLTAATVSVSKPHASPKTRGPDTVADSEVVPVWAWVAGGVGIAAAAASVVFFIDEASVARELDDRCGGAPRDRCPADYDFDAAHSREKRDFGLAIGLGIVGLAGIAVGTSGVILGMTDSHRDSALVLQPSVSFDRAGVSLHARF